MYLIKLMDLLMKINLFFRFRIFVELIANLFFYINLAFDYYKTQKPKIYQFLYFLILKKKMTLKLN